MALFETLLRRNNYKHFHEHIFHGLILAVSRRNGYVINNIIRDTDVKRGKRIFIILLWS